MKVSAVVLLLVEIKLIRQLFVVVVFFAVYTYQCAPHLLLVFVKH